MYALAGGAPGPIEDNCFWDVGTFVSDNENNHIQAREIRSLIVDPRFADVANLNFTVGNVNAVQMGANKNIQLGGFAGHRVVRPNFYRG